MSYYFQKRLALLKRIPFLNFSLGCFFAALGNGLGYIAMSWLVVSQYGSVESIAILMGCFWGPNVLLGPLMGVLADKLQRKTIVTLSCFIRGGLFIAFSLYLIFHFHMILIYCLMLLVGSIFSAYYSTVSRFVRELVPANELMYANSTVDMAYEVGNVLGMGFAGFIIAWSSTENAILINGIAFIIAGILLACIPKTALCYGEKYVRTHIHLWQDYREGLQYLLERKNLLSAYTIQLTILITFLTAPLLLVPFSKTVLHTTVAQFGCIEAMMSVGIVAGGIFIPWISERYGLFRTLLFFSILLSVTFLLFGYNRNIMLANIMYCLIGFAGAVWPLMISYAQNLTSIHFQGRVQSTFNSLSGATMLIFYFSFGVTGKYFGVAHLYYIEVAITLIAILLLVTTNSYRSFAYRETLVL